MVIILAFTIGVYLTNKNIHIQTKYKKFFELRKAPELISEGFHPELSS